MKFMLNGALTLGTMDGANVEIAELVGKDNIFTFGESSETVIARYERGDYKSKDWYEKDKALKAAVDFIVGKEMMKIGQKENLDRLYKELLNKDWFMTFPDFEDYVKTREEAYAAYSDRTEWAKKMLINISKAGFFSSEPHHCSSIMRKSGSCHNNILLKAKMRSRCCGSSFLFTYPSYLSRSRTFFTSPTSNPICSAICCSVYFSLCSL